MLLTFMKGRNIWEDSSLELKQDVSKKLDKLKSVQVQENERD